MCWWWLRAPRQDNHGVHDDRAAPTLTGQVRCRLCFTICAPSWRLHCTPSWLRDAVVPFPLLFGRVLRLHSTSAPAFPAPPPPPACGAPSPPHTPPHRARSISVYGQDLSEDMGSIRAQVGVGVCPQHDVLFPDLTVEEHLRLFAGLKGVPPGKVDAAVKDTIATVGLTEKVQLAAPHPC
jgi:hypothetical protein